MPEPMQPAEPPRAPPDNRNSTVEALFKGPEAAGVRVIVHDPAADPVPALGIGVAPGTAADLAFRRVDRSRLYKPYGTCSPDWHADLGGTDVSGYTKHACERDCYLTAVADACECLLLPWPSTLAERPTLYVCSNTEKTCIDEQLSLFQAGQLGCGSACPDRCLESEYSVTVGTQAWPATSSQTTILDIVAAVKGETSVPVEYLSKNLLTVRVFPPTNEFQRVTSKQYYTIDALLSDIGGNTGLWAGVSALTVVEIVEFFVLFCCGTACCCCAARRRAKRAPYVAASQGTSADETQRLASSGSLRHPASGVGATTVAAPASSQPTHTVSASSVKPSTTRQAWT